MTDLNMRQIRQLEHDLLAQRSGVAAEAHDELTRATQQSYAEIAGEVPDFGDQATAASLADYDNALARRHVEALREIDDALERIKAQRFGRCLECGVPMRYARLRAFPAARRCVACQSLRERTFAVGATPTL
jgi:RNA polymerase-binding transcription factor DksA